jgi:hypothetical protein
MTEGAQDPTPSSPIASPISPRNTPTQPAMTTAAAYKDRQFLAVIGDEARDAAAAAAPAQAVC